MPKTIEEMAGRWLTRHKHELSETESEVLQSAIDRQPISRDRNEAFASERTTGERLADGIARFGGSWPFIVFFLLFMVFWTAMNAWLLQREAFDPYPFVFLNLILSMLAALQAPVIMMSQNRQSERDRQDAAHDYAVNLKAEIEIMALHEKLDSLRHMEIVALRQEVTEIRQMLEAASAAPVSGHPARGRPDPGSEE